MVKVRPVGFHEDLNRSAPQTGPSDRNFGTVFTLFFVVVGIAPLRHHGGLRYWALGLAAAFLLATIATPRLLHPMNLVWSKLGLLLGKVTSPIFTAVLFFLVFTPVAWVLRWMGRDAMSRAFHADAPSYWIPRSPPGPSPEGMTRQF